MKNTTKALLVVDMQNDFITGTLRVPGAESLTDQVAHFIAEHGGDYDYLISTQDWHIDPHSHFSDDPDYKDSWPEHCKAYTWGGAIHDSIKKVDFNLAIRKGHYNAAYSGFEGYGVNGWNLRSFLTEKKVQQIDIIGLALDHCVKATALDGITEGFRVHVLKDYTLPVNHEKGAEAVEAMVQAGVVIE